MADVLDEAFSTGDDTVQPDQGQGHVPADTSAVQPEGQGQQDTTTGLYDLSSITDPAIRSEVERIAKDIDRNANAKFQEHAEYRKGWEGFEGIGLQEYDPEGVGALLKFAEALGEGGDTAREALVNLAASLEIDLGLTPAEPDPNAEQPLTRAEFEQWQREQMEARQEEQLIAQYEQEELAKLREEYAEVEKANGKPFTDQEKERLQNLARRFQADHDTPIKAAFEFINSIAGSAEAALVEAQPKPPQAAELGGRASSAVQPVDSFEEAERLHKERNRSVHS